MPNILQPMVRRRSHAMAHYSMEYQHDIHGLDVLLDEGRMAQGPQRMKTPIKVKNWSR